MATFDFQYKTAASLSWANVPKSSYGTRDGTLEVRYPKTTDFDGLGRPCGAIGPVDVIINATTMTWDGFDWWSNLFSASTSEYGELWIKAINPRTASWNGWAGYLIRPEFGSTVLGTSTSNSYLKDVQIVVANCEVYNS